MTRLARRLQHSEGLCYHVFSRGHNRQTIFHDDDDRGAFIEKLAGVRKRFQFALHHWCLMGNHYHLVLRVREVEHLSRLMAGLLRSYVHHYHRRYGFVGHLWQGRFKSPAVQDGTYLLTAGRYVERNPVEAGMASAPWEYRWSSCRYWVLGVEDGVTAEPEQSPEYADLASTPAERCLAWRAFLVSVDPNEEAMTKSDWAIGDAEFQRRLRDRRGRAEQRRRGRPLSHVAGNGRIKS
jgi:putative transposase